VYFHKKLTKDNVLQNSRICEKEVGGGDIDVRFVGGLCSETYIDILVLILGYEVWSHCLVTRLGPEVWSRGLVPLFGYEALS
jgi:hypothetical protein